MATDKDNTISSFKGLRYINALFSALEKLSVEDDKKLFFSPKFIYRGESKIYPVHYGEMKDYKTELLGLQLWKDKPALLYKNVQDKAKEEFQKLQKTSDGNPWSLIDAYMRLNEPIPFNELLMPDEIRSGASIRLRSALKKEEKLSVASYLHYIRSLISDIKATYPSFSKMSDLDVLAEIQHKGGASCLVDFSTNFLIALWFATQKDPKDFGYMYCYDVNGESFRTDNVSFITEQHANKSIEEILLATKKTTNFTSQKSHKFWVWKPKNLNSRIARQDSVFVFGLEPFFIREHDVYVLPIPPKWKKAIQSALKSFFGLSSESIYPDSDGFANSHCKTNELAEPTNYINPHFINGSLKYAEEYQKGLSSLIKGQYGLALKLLTNLENENQVNIQKYLSCNDNAIFQKRFERFAVIMELKYSIALCYHKLGNINEAYSYYIEAFEAFDLAFQRLDSRAIEYRDSKSWRNPRIQYLQNKFKKITNDFIQLSISLGAYEEALSRLEKFEFYEFNLSIPLVNTIREKFAVLSELKNRRSIHNVPLIQREGKDEIPTYYLLHLYFILLHKCYEYKQDREDTDMTHQLFLFKSSNQNLLNALFDKIREVRHLTEPLYFSFDFDEMQKAYHSYFRGKEVMINFLDEITVTIRAAFRIAQNHCILSRKLD